MASLVRTAAGFSDETQHAALSHLACRIGAHASEPGATRRELSGLTHLSRARVRFASFGPPFVTRRSVRAPTNVDGIRCIAAARLAGPRLRFAGDGARVAIGTASAGSIF